MILIVDNNDERRRNIHGNLRLKGYLTSYVGYDELEFYTKPYFTIYINPSKNELNNLKNDNTISVIFSERASLTLPKWTINILSLKDIVGEIVRIYDEKCPYQIVDKVDVVGYACIKNGRFALGGERIKLSGRERQIISFFMYNHDKRFKLYDACRYVRILENPEENYLGSIKRLNKKAKDVNREDIIICKNDICYLNPDIADYICKEENIIITENMPAIYLDLIDYLD